MNSLYSHRQSSLTFPAMTIEIESLSHAYGSQAILHEVSLTVAPGEVLCVLGPSGSGKSTLLRLIAGLEPIQTGRLRIGDSEITVSQTVPTEVRRVGLVFQDHALFPHMTVAENIRFGLKGESEERINTLLALVELTHFQDRYPHTLSGGQQQRVALIRALANDPIAMLLDEPFANVDVALRTALRDDALGALRKTGTATVLVTHDPAEAMLMADRIACLVDGRIVQLGTPEDLWRHPAHPFVALSLTGAQLISGTAMDGQVATAFGTINSSPPVSGEVIVSVRQSDATIIPGEQAVISDVRFGAGGTIASLRSGNDRLLIETDRTDLTTGMHVGVGFDTSSLKIFPAK